MNMGAWIAIFLVGFAALWVAISYVLSFVGGWRTLAEHYRAPEDITTERNWRFQSGIMSGIMRYNGALSIGTNRTGMRLSMLFLFPGHPTLFIPWSDVTVTAQKRLFVMLTVFQFARAPEATLALRERVAREVLRPFDGTP